MRADPLPWLLAEDAPAVRAATLLRLLDRAADDGDVASARRAAMSCNPIAAILAAQHPGGWWVTTDAGGFGSSGAAGARRPPPSSVIHCLNGNLLGAMIGFGRLDDARVQGALEWAARAITGEDVARWYASGTSGPGFACAANEGLPCAWGALKELAALARVPVPRRSPLVRRALDDGIAFLLSRDPAVADYPMGWGNTKPNGSWFKPGFPHGYVGDVLETLEVLAALGRASDPQLEHALGWVQSQQDAQGRWRNRYAYNGKTWVDIERQGEPSKWVTLRACTVLRAAYG